MSRQPSSNQWLCMRCMPAGERGGALNLASAVAKVIAGVCCALVMAWDPAPAAAQFLPKQGLSGEERSALETEYEAAFQAVFKDPGNLDKTFRYAELAVAVGDLEGAISALERMLIYNPKLPRVRLELGSLYFRLGSYAIAKSYLTRAIAGEDVPPEVRDRVLAFLEEIEDRQSVHRFSGSIYAGMRFQTNANAGPTGRAVRAIGQNFELDEEFTGQPDYNGFALVSLKHAYDLQNQAGDYIETNAHFFGSKQVEQTQVDLLLGDINTGYRAKLLPGTLTNATWRPYVLADVVRLDRALFFYTGGGGLNFTNQFKPNLLADLTVEARVRRYNDTESQPNNTDRNADEYLVRLGLAYRVTPDVELRLTGFGVDENAKKGFNSNREYGVRLGYTQTFDAPFGITSGRWVAAISVARIHTDHRSPDPSVDPLVTREDREWRFNALASVPINEAWSIVATVGRTDTKSNLPNFTRDNDFASLGASWQF